jgi:phosphohistidine phosphatase
MHQLLLLRHAKSSWDDPKQADRDRPLNHRGQRAAAAIREAMQELGLAPDLVLVSPARRVLETLEALEPWDETPLHEQIEALYLATPAQILGILRDVAETVRSVLLIGHNPGMHDLAQSLIHKSLIHESLIHESLIHESLIHGGAPTDAARRLAVGFPTGALAEFAVAGPWLRLGPGAARLTRFITPRELDRSG